MEEKLKWWVVRYYQEGCGDYGCGGYVDGKFIVAARSKEEVIALLGKRESYESEYEISEWTELPDLKRKKKPFIWL